MSSIFCHLLPPSIQHNQSMNEPWKRFITLYLIQFLQLLDFISIGPTGAMFVSEQKILTSSISFSLGAYSVTAILGSVIIARFRKMEPKLLLIVLLTFFTLSQVALAFRVTDLTFIVSRLIGGFTGGLMGAISYSQLSSIEDKNQGVWNGRIQTAQSLVTLVGLPVCLLLIAGFGARIYFSITSTLTLIVILNLGTSSFLKRQIPNEESSLSLKSITRHLDIIFSGFICYFASFLFISQMPNFLLNIKKISTNELSIAYAISGILTLLISGSIGKMSDRYNAKSLLIFFASLLIASQLIFSSQLSSYAILFFGLPFYLILSTGRAIHQRSIILQKKNEDSVLMHLINNISLRSGILLSGVTLGIISTYHSDISDVFRIANFSSIICGILIITGFSGSLLLERKKCPGIK